VAAVLGRKSGGGF